MEVFRQVSRVIDSVNQTIGQGVAWLTLGIVILGSFNAVARFLAKGIGVDLSSNGFIELQWYLFSIIFLLGASYTLQQKGHVRVDVLYDQLGVKGRLWVNLLGHGILMIPFCIFVIWLTVPWVINSWKIWEGSPDPGGLPRYPIKTMVPLGFVFLLLQGVSEFIKDLDKLRSGDFAEEGENEEVAL